MRAVKLLRSFPVCNISLCNGSSGYLQMGGQNTPSALKPDRLRLAQVFKDWSAKTASLRPQGGF